MVIIPILFWLLLLVCCGYAAAYGGRDGRWAAAMLVAASVLTVPATLLGQSFGRTELALFAVDFALLCGLYMLMLKSRAYWPIWMVGFHLVAVVTHLSTMIVPEFGWKIYRMLETVWALPVLISMLVGIAKDRTAEVRATLAAKRSRFRAPAPH